MSGSIVKQARSGGEDVQIDVSNIPTGVYIVHIYDGINNIPYSQKIAINR